MEMNKRGMSALALLGSLLLVSGAAQASETLNHPRWRCGWRGRHHDRQGAGR